MFLHLRTCIYIIGIVFILLPLSLLPPPSHWCQTSPSRAEPVLPSCSSIL
jgi:hypothetical protein